MPKWLVCHPYNDMLGDGLPECERTWAFDFRVMTPTAWWRVPMRNGDRRPADRRARAVPHPQDDAAAVPVPTGREKHWVLKGFHGSRLQEFFDAYPDAS